MNRTPHDSQRLGQLMDACRPGSDDLSLAEMADLASALGSDGALRSEWESRQRSDRVVAAAMYEVAIPAGLAERILSAASAHDGERLAEATAAAAVVEAKPTADAVSVSPKATPRASRRAWLAWTGGLAVALVAAIVAWNIWGPKAEVSRVQLAASAQEWFTAALKPTASPNAPTVAAPVPFPQQAVALKLQRWWRLTTREERTLVAFDLTRPQFGGHVFLFAAKTTKKYQVGSLPFTRLTATGGLEIGAWQQGDVIYVLVVDTQNSKLHLESVLRDPNLAYLPRGQR